MEQESNKNSQGEGFYETAKKAFDEITKRAEEAWGKFEKEYENVKVKNAPEIEEWKKKASVLWGQFQKEASESYQTAKEKWAPQVETFLRDAKEALNKANEKAEEFAEKARHEFGQWKKGKDNRSEGSEPTA